MLSLIVCKTAAFASVRKPSRNPAQYSEGGEKMNKERLKLFASISDERYHELQHFYFTKVSRLARKCVMHGRGWIQRWFSFGCYRLKENRRAVVGVVLEEDAIGAQLLCFSIDGETESWEIKEQSGHQLPSH